MKNKVGTNKLKAGAVYEKAKLISKNKLKKVTKALRKSSQWKVN